jgi:hypothetical protein
MTTSRRQGNPWALGGVLVAVFFIAGDVLRGMLTSNALPLPGASAAEVARYFTDSQTAVLVVAAVQILSFRVLQIDYYACLYCGLPAVLVKAVFDRHAIPPSAARAGRRRAPSPACGWSRAWSRSGSAPSPSTGWVMLTAENDYGSSRTTSCCTASWGCRAGYAGGAAGLARVACAANKESLRLV